MVIIGNNKQNISKNHKNNSLFNKNRMKILNQIWLNFNNLLGINKKSHFLIIYQTVQLKRQWIQKNNGCNKIKLINKHLGLIMFHNNNIEREAITEEEDIIKTIILRIIIMIIKIIKIIKIMAIIIIIDNNNKIHIKVGILEIMDLLQEIKIIITNRKVLKEIVINILSIETKQI